MTAVSPPLTDPLATAKAADPYRVHEWGNSFFSVNRAGHVTVTHADLDLFEIVQGLAERDLRAPVLIRFTDILADRLRAIRDAFHTAMKENDYKGGYRAVYPIKVNQQHQVVDELVRFGTELGFGLEVGSKPELLAVLALSTDQPDHPIICNGFKDAQYIEAVVLASKLGRLIIPVVENLGELREIIRFAKQYNVRPSIGIRVKLASGGSGKWQASAGTKSKFGLFVSDVMQAVELLREHDMLDCLELLHCHAGSQVQNIRSVKDVTTELTHVYIELAKLGAGLKYLDIGGGMGIDYSGAQNNTPGSMNYTLEEFASDVVYRVGSICDNADGGGVPHPTIITECGRAMVAYSSVLVFNVVSATGPSLLPEPPQDISRLTAQEEKVPQPILDLYDAYTSVEPRRVAECYHDALQARDAAMTLFSLGYLSLELRALTEQLFWATCRRIHTACDAIPDEELPEHLDTLDDLLCDTYFCNFSLFQSLPDAWAIDQLFPVMPIHRLNEYPTRQAVLADVTCDSDGVIDHFIGDPKTHRSLPVHELKENEPYYLGVFLVGAYQETLGDLHNLFGDAHAVHISADPDNPGEWQIEEVVRGDTAQEVLQYVQYEPDRLLSTMRRDCERAVKSRRLTVAESQVLVKFYERSLRAYTYLEQS
ncbi:MAG: biosynthetic arginine decarboxylase [Planctomycetota bacterium]